VESVDDVRTKMVLDRRRCPAAPESRNTRALKAIVDNVVAIIQSAAPAPQYSVQ